MVQVIPLSCHQGKVIEEAGELLAEGCASGEPPAKNLIEIVQDEMEREDGTNACSFLAFKIVDSLVDANYEFFKTSNVKSVVEKTITSFPAKINSLRDKSSHFSVDEAHYILDQNKLLSRQYVLKEVLSIAVAGQSAGGEIEMLEALKQMANRQTNTFSLYTCSPIIFALIHIFEQDQSSFIVIDTHKIPEKVGGNGNGVIAYVNYQKADRNDAITDLARWIRERISSSVMRPSPQSLLEIEETQVVFEETWKFPGDEEKQEANDDLPSVATTTEKLKNKERNRSSAEMDYLNFSETLDSSNSLTNKVTAEEILSNFQPLLWAKMHDFDGSLKQRNIDAISMALLPTDFNEWVPLTILGDGNCLYNAVSISLVDNISLAALLRMLTASELFTYSEFYAKHPQLEDFAKKSGYSLAAITSIFLSENNAQRVFNGKRANASKAIETLAQATAKPYVYSSPFNILALASVIRRPIFSAYPDQPTALRMKLATHGFYYPKEAFTSCSDIDDITSDAIYVMWTRTNQIPITPWKPNHFVLLKKKTDVPLVKIDTSAARKTSSPCSSSPETAESPFSEKKRPIPKVVLPDNSIKLIAKPPNVIQSARENQSEQQSEMEGQQSSVSDSHLRSNITKSAKWIKECKIEKYPGCEMSTGCTNSGNSTCKTHLPIDSKTSSALPRNSTASFLVDNFSSTRGVFTTSTKNKPSSRPSTYSKYSISEETSLSGRKSHPNPTESKTFSPTGRSKKLQNETPGDKELPYTQAMSADQTQPLKHSDDINLKKKAAKRKAQPLHSCTTENRSFDNLQERLFDQSNVNVEPKPHKMAKNESSLDGTHPRNSHPLFSSSSLQSKCKKRKFPGMFWKPQFTRLRRRGAKVKEPSKTGTKSDSAANTPSTVKIHSYFTPVKHKASPNVKTDSFFTPAKPEQVTAVSPDSNVYNIIAVSNEDVLPLKGPDMQWYTKRGINFNSNLARTEEQTRNAVIIQDNEMKGLIRGNAKGTLAQNVECLIERLSTAGSSKQHAHLSVMISLASHIMNNGLLVSTQDLAKKYKDLKGLKASAHLDSSCLLEIMSKHLNVAQIYIEGKGYIIENHGKELVKVVESLHQMSKSDQAIVNQRVEEAVGSSYKTLLQYLDTKRDRDTVKAILAKITSVKFMTKLANVQDRRGFQNWKGLVFRNLHLFEEMKQKIDVNEMSMTEEGKRRKRNRILQKMKMEKLRHVFKGRGRSLKCEDFPDLAGILEFAFGEGDRVDRAGGGLESHPRLTDTVLYRAADSNTIMRHARETILALAPEGFKISLSTCFNYTQNYREGTYQARRHHSGRGINACLSLHKPPRTGVEEFVINLHWSTQNVNLTLDLTHSLPNDILVDSKDAKAKINADISPVQKPGKSWRKITLPDHDWNRSAQNSITPMSHLFVQTDVTLEDQRGQNLVYSVRRTGSAATLLNISFFEPETIHRVCNEIFLLLKHPSLDHHSRNLETGKLKKHFVFIVDNGPSKAPSNPLVQMWQVRLARVMKLKSITQKSFAEYHSKRNLVERVHAVQNHALSNEQFSSKAIHPECEKGDTKHKENMEHMAEEVRKCLATTQYGGKPCTVMRGIGGQENFVFDDEEHLVAFLGKNENRKADDVMQYKPVQNDLWREISTLWDLDEDFTGSYREDYEIVKNKFHERGQRTCWMDKYSTTIFNPDVECDSEIEAFTVQPLPDYVRWISTGGEVHYLPLEKVQKLDTQVVDGTPAAFLPSKILEMVFKVFSHGTDNILQSISFLTWCTKKDVIRFFQNYNEKLDKSFQTDKAREYWSQDELYKCKNKEQLEELCRKERIPTEGKKHDCVQRLVEKMGTARPPPLEDYKGSLRCIPASITDIAKLSIYKLKEILQFHNVLDCGTKDELVVHVGMVRAGRGYLAFHRETEAIRNLITATRNIIIAEKEMYLEDPKVIHKRRRFATKSGLSLETERPRDSASIPHQNQSAFLPVPIGLSLDNLEEALTPLSDELALYQKRQQENSETSESVPLDTILEAMRSVGARVRILWEKDEVGTTGWRTGM